jgi:hypothetical protein
MDTFNSPLPQEPLGEYIKRLRVKLKMSQNQLAVAAGETHLIFFDKM